jgi:hypothetical protein
MLMADPAFEPKTETEVLRLTDFDRMYRRAAKSRPTPRPPFDGQSFRTTSLSPARLSSGRESVQMLADDDRPSAADAFD